jgi:hypothetical protein
MLSDEYIAGFFDGEGSVGIDAYGKVRVSIAQKRPEILYMIQEQYNGYVYSKHHPVFEGYMLNFLGKKDCQKILTAIFPYLVVKRDEVEIALKAVELIKDHHRGCDPLSYNELKERHKLRDKLQTLRPKKTFVTLESLNQIYRNRIKQEFVMKCNVCGKDLSTVRIRDQVISQDKLWCRACVASFYKKDRKPISKQQMENAIASSDNMWEVCDKLGIGRSALYQKRKKYGLEIQFNKKDRKPITKQQIIDAINATNTIKEAQKMLGICSETMWHKRKKFGLLGAQVS